MEYDYGNCRIVWARYVGVVDCLASGRAPNSYRAKGSSGGYGAKRVEIAQVKSSGKGRSETR
jgi:hypothetical protein